MGTDGRTKKPRLPARSASPSPLLRIRIYVAGRAPNSLTAIANLKAFLSASPEFAADVEVVDVLKDPLRGLEDGVLVTPTTVRLAPLPECRIIGSLRDQDALRLAFDPPASDQ